MASTCSRARSKKEKWPNAVIIAHGGAALLSIALLIVLLLGNNGASRDAEPGIVPVTPGADGGSVLSSPNGDTRDTTQSQ